MEWLLKERGQMEQYVALLEDEIQAMTAKLRDCDVRKDMRFCPQCRRTKAPELLKCGHSLSSPAVFVLTLHITVTKL
jgi:hypothetical protein